MKGYEPLIRIMESLPLDSRGAAELLNCAQVQAAKRLRWLCAAGLIKPVGKTPGRNGTTIYGPGESRNGYRPSATVITFAAVLRALEVPSSTADLARSLGFQLRHAQTLVQQMHRRLIRIARWDVEGKIRTAVYQLGRGPDARRPARVPRKVYNARLYAGLREKRRMQEFAFALAGRPLPLQGPAA